MKANDIMFFLDKPILLQLKGSLIIPATSEQVGTVETENGQTQSYYYPLPGVDPSSKQLMASPCLPGTLSAEESASDVFAFQPQNAGGAICAIKAEDIFAIWVLPVDETRVNTPAPSPKVIIP